MRKVRVSRRNNAAEEIALIPDKTMPLEYGGDASKAALAART
jgi:hypothetical protein